MTRNTFDVDVITKLQEILSADQVVTDPRMLADLAYDSAVGLQAGEPLVAVFPTSTEQVSQIMALADLLRVVVVAQGRRTGLSGAANAQPGCILLNLSRFDKILSIDVADQVAVVEPGVITKDLDRAARAKGLFYPVDPGSVSICSIGGNVSTNSGGMRCVKYGVTADSVRSLTVVLAGGDVIETGHLSVKGVAGLDLTRLFVGAEGTLGVVTRITVALRPAPTSVAGASGVFRTVADAIDAVRRVMAQPNGPSALELMDRATIRAIQAYDPAASLPADAGAMLIIESDASGTAVADVQRYLGHFLEAGATRVVEADSAEEVEALLDVRRQMYPALREQHPAILTEDVAVPRGRLIPLIEAIERAAVETGAPIATGGHVGDGNLHPLIGYDPQRIETFEAASAAFRRIVKAATELGGTISGEHGIGTLKRAEREYEFTPQLLDLQLRIKRALDPHGILNPGRKV